MFNRCPYIAGQGATRRGLRELLAAAGYALIVLTLAALCSAQSSESPASGAQNPPSDNKTSSQKSEKTPSEPVKNQADESYVIGPSDVLAINVWKEPEISRAIPVRS